MSTKTYMRPTMHPIERAIDRVVCQARRWQWMRSIANLLSVSIAVIAVTGLIDYIFRVQDVGVRIILSLGTFGVIAWTAARLLLPLWRSPVSAMQVARGLDRQYPELRDSVSSSLAFLQQETDDLTAGSSMLRRAVIAETEARIAPYDLIKSLDVSAMQRSQKYCGMLLVLCAVISLFRPADVGRSIQRLLIPWDAVEWPRIHSLLVVSPSKDDRVAVGADVEFRVIDERSDLPPSVVLELSFAGDSESDVRAYEMEYRGGTMVKLIENVERAMRYRVRGGDDQRQLWHDLDVVDPPRLQSLTMQLEAPAYTGWPHETAEGSFRVLSGTRIGLSGKVSQPVQSATLVTRDSGGATNRYPLIVDPENSTISLALSGEVPCVVESSLEYWIELVGKSGIAGLADQKWQITAVPDRPPTVTFRQPLPTAVLATSIVPVEIVAQDDLAVDSVQLRYSVADSQQGQPTNIEIFRRQTPATELSDDLKGQLRGVASIGAEKSEQVTYEWNMNGIALDPAQSILDVTIVAVDSKGQEASTDMTRVQMMSRESLATRLAQQQSRLLERIGELLGTQRDIMSRTNALQSEFAASSTDRPDQEREANDRLKAIELNQREFRHQLVLDGQSVLAQTRELLRQLRMSAIETTEIGTQLLRLEEVILSLDEAELEPLQRQLIDVVKRDTATPAMPGTVAEQLKQSAGHQLRVVETLEDLVDQQSAWDQLRQFSQAVDQLVEEQRAIQQQLQESLTLANDTQSDTGAEHADMDQVARRLSDSARRLDKTILDMQDQFDLKASISDAIAARLQRSLELARREAISGRMRDASRFVRQGQLGRATIEQEPVIESLQQLSQSLTQEAGDDQSGAPTNASTEQQRDGERQEADRRMARLAQLVRGWHAQQVSYRDDTIRFAERWSNQDRPSSTDVESLRVIESQQRSLAQELGANLAEFDTTPVLAFALRNTQGQMELATAALRKSAEFASVDADEKPIDAAARFEQLAAQRLAQILQALTQANSQETNEAGQPPGSAANSEAGPGQGEEKGAAPQQRIEELRLLKGMQEELVARTTALDQAQQAKGGLSVDQQRELEYVVGQQSELVQIIERIIAESNR